MLVSFDLQGGFPVCAARGLAVAAVLSSFGSLMFRCLVAPKAFAGMAPGEVLIVRRRLLLVTQASSVAAVFGYGAWLLVQAGYMADADSLAGSAGAVPSVLTKTVFGHVIIGQFLCLLLQLGLAGVRDRDRVWRQRAALAAATMSVALQAGHSHAYSMHDGPSLLLWCDVLHLLGAGAWLGDLIPLIVLIGAAPPKAGALAARWFSPLGKACIAALALSAGVQGWVLVATIPGLVGTAYGWMVLVKCVLFAALLGFAAANRYRFAPALLHARAGDAKAVLLRSILVQTGVAVLIIAAAVVLSDLPPAMHGQPAWPFSERFSLAAIEEDPDFRREVMLAGLALGGAACVMLVCLVRRRFRLAGAAVLAVTAWFAIPHFDLLLVTAYPTSFYHSPTGFASSSIVDGRAIYAGHCVACHGAAGHGDGPAAHGLAVPPADLTADHLWMHSDGELFWWLTAGMQTPEGAAAMPGFAAVLDEDQRWAAIDFIRAHNAGVKMAATGAWTMQLHAPGFGIVCGRDNLKLRDLAGKFVLVRFDASGAAAGLQDVVTVLAGAHAQPRDASAGICTSSDETVPAAYGIVSGIDVGHLQGMAFLIDDHGMLRALQQGGAGATWRDPVMLDAEIRFLRAHPVTEPAPMTMPMNMPM